jgi:hypothetical protein
MAAEEVGIAHPLARVFIPRHKPPRFAWSVRHGGGRLLVLDDYGIGTDRDHCTQVPVKGGGEEGRRGEEGEEGRRGESTGVVAVVVVAVVVVLQ